MAGEAKARGICCRMIVMAGCPHSLTMGRAPLLRTSKPDSMAPASRGALRVTQHWGKIRQEGSYGAGCGAVTVQCGGVQWRCSGDGE